MSSGMTITAGIDVGTGAVKTVLFLVGGLIEEDQGTSALDRVGGLAARRPVIAVLFALPALSLAGLPPFSGFVAKLSLVDAGIAEPVAHPDLIDRRIGPGTANSAQGPAMTEVEATDAASASSWLTTMMMPEPNT